MEPKPNDQPESRTKRLARERREALGLPDLGEPSEVRKKAVCDKPPLVPLPAIKSGKQVYLDTGDTEVVLEASPDTGAAVPVGRAPMAPKVMQEDCRRWGPKLIERLVAHAMSSDGRIALPAIAMLLDRGYGKAKDLPDESGQQAQLLSALPVRDRIKALLEASGNPAGVVESPWQKDGSNAQGTSTASPPEQPLQ